MLIRDRLARRLLIVGVLAVAISIVLLFSHIGVGESLWAELARGLITMLLVSGSVFTARGIRFELQTRQQGEIDQR